MKKKIITSTEPPKDAPMMCPSSVTYQKWIQQHGQTCKDKRGS